MRKLNHMNESIQYGDFNVDDRGRVTYFNNFDPVKNNIRRMYIVENHKRGQIRCWHAHEKANQFVTMLSGSAIIGAVKIDVLQSAIHNSKMENFDKSFFIKRIISFDKPEILLIPNGWAQGAMTLTPDAKILYMSDKTLNEIKNDDHRFNSNLFRDMWEVRER